MSDPVRRTCWCRVFLLSTRSDAVEQNRGTCQERETGELDAELLLDVTRIDFSAETSWTLSSRAPRRSCSWTGRTDGSRSPGALGGFGGLATKLNAAAAPDGQDRARDRQSAGTESSLLVSRGWANASFFRRRCADTPAGSMTLTLCNSCAAAFVSDIARDAH
jgi:hypothetical protein